MHIVIMGCGRVGSALAQTLEQQGHTVAVIDQDPTAFRRLGSGFGGRRVTGVGFDQDTLREAGIEEAEVFIASTDGDNTNLTIAQLASKRYGVPKVIARVMDPARAEWYAEQGLHTICPTRFAIEMFERALEV